MLYMILSIFLMIMTLQEMFRTMAQLGNNSFTGSRAEVFIIVMLSPLMMAPLFMTFYMAAETANLDSLSRLSVGAQWTGALAAAGLMAAYGRRAIRNVRRFWSTGGAIAAAAIALIYADSLHFVSRPDAGVMASFVLDQGGSYDVECGSPALLVHYTRGKPTDYRCPKGLALMSDSSRPFVPWPDYYSGRSQKLTDTINTIMDSAQKAEKQ